MLSVPAAQSIEIRLDWPPPELKPYSRIHWAALAAAKREYRRECRLLARNAMDTRTAYPLSAPVEALVVFTVPKGGMPDTDNALASIKAGIDGICDAGVLANDRDIASW